MLERKTEPAARDWVTAPTVAFERTVEQALQKPVAAGKEKAARMMAARQDLTLMLEQG